MTVLDTPSRLKALRPDPLPLAVLVQDKPVDEVAALLPRLFNLCRAAQDLAARLALGLPAPQDAEDRLRQEILRDHLVKFCMSWPGKLGLGQYPLPPGWAQGGVPVAKLLFGPDHRWLADPDWFARNCAHFDRTQDNGIIGRILPALARTFAPQEAVCDALPVASADTIFDTGIAQENSVAARRLNHPVMQRIAAGWGRGPLWRAIARALDAAALLENRFDILTRHAPGFACLPATRGLYAVRAEVAQGRVRRLERVTPTDHLTTRGGVLDQALASLPAAKQGLAPLLMDILDPCSPVRLIEARHA